MHVYAPPDEFAKLRHRNGLVVYPGARTPLRRHRATDHGIAEVGLYFGLPGTIANGQRVGAATKHEFQRIHKDRLAGTSLASQNVQPRSKQGLCALDNRKISNCESLKHKLSRHLHLCNRKLERAMGIEPT